MSSIDIRPATSPKPDAEAEHTPERLKCFVVCPIGGDGSTVRIRSDDVFAGLIQPACEASGYVAQRVTDQNRPGDITGHIIEAIFDADLVIIDITDHNPNVFYETAIRHMTGRPFIHIKGDSNHVPFDITTLSVITYDCSSFVGVATSLFKLREQIEEVKKGRLSFINPAVEKYRKITVDQKFDSDATAQAIMQKIASTERENIELGKQLRMSDTKLRESIIKNDDLLLQIDSQRTAVRYAMTFLMESQDEDTRAHAAVLASILDRAASHDINLSNPLIKPTFAGGGREYTRE